MDILRGPSADRLYSPYHGTSRCIHTCFFVTCQPFATFGVLALDELYPLVLHTRTFSMLHARPGSSFSRLRLLGILDVTWLPQADSLLSPEIAAAYLSRMEYASTLELLTASGQIANTIRRVYQSLLRLTLCPAYDG